VEVDTDPRADILDLILCWHLPILAIQQQRHRIHADENRRERLDAADAKQLA